MTGEDGGQSAADPAPSPDDPAGEEPSRPEAVADTPEDAPADALEDGTVGIAGDLPAGTVGIAGDLPAGTVVTVRDDTGRERPVPGRSISLPPGTYVMEAGAPGHDMDQQTLILRAGAVETWVPRLRVQAPDPAPGPVPQAPAPEAATPRPAVDSSADQAAVDAAVRAFVTAFDARNSATVVPLLPEHRRAVYTRLLGDDRNVTAFSAALENIQPASVQGDVATVAFDIVVSFRNFNQANRIPHSFTGRAVRVGTGWRLESLQDR